MRKIMLSFVWFALLISTSCTSVCAQQPHAIKRVLLVVAMEKEALPMIKALHLQPSAHAFGRLPMRGYEGTFNGIAVFLIMNGQDAVHKIQNVGTQPATLSTYLGIEYFHPDLVISIGSAGGMEKYGAKVGAIYLSKFIYFDDRHIPGVDYDAYAVGGYTSATLNLHQQKQAVQDGNVCSSDSFELAPLDEATVNQKQCAALDMEAAAVAWVSMLTKTPMVAVKGITNIVGHVMGHREYENNLPAVTAELASVLKEILNQLA